MSRSKVLAVGLAAAAVLFMVSGAAAQSDEQSLDCSKGTFFNNPANLFVPPNSTQTKTITFHFKKPMTNPIGWVVKSWGYHVTAGAQSSQSFWTSFSSYRTTINGTFASSSSIYIPVIGVNPLGNADDLLIIESWACVIPTLGWAGLLILIALVGIAGILILRRQMRPKVAG